MATIKNKYIFLCQKVFTNKNNSGIIWTEIEGKMTENTKESLVKRFWKNTQRIGKKAILLLATTIGMGQHSGDAMVLKGNSQNPKKNSYVNTITAEQNTSSDSEASLNYADYVQEYARIPKPPYSAEFINKTLTEKYNQALAENMITNNENTLGNFDLSNYSWDRTTLPQIQSCPSNDAIVKTASQNVNKKRPEPGKQTYCLGAVKRYLAAHGIELNASRFAYRAIEALQNDDHFVELKGVTHKDFTALPDGAILVFDKGKDHPYGHICIKKSETWKGNTVNYELSDHRYYLTDNKRYGYGDVHVFVLKDMMVSKELAMKLAKENLISSKYKAAFEINQAKNNCIASAPVTTKYVPTVIAQAMSKTAQAKTGNDSKQQMYNYMLRNKRYTKGS